MSTKDEALTSLASDHSGLTPDEWEALANRAHELYVAGGSEDGHDLQHWLEAEAQVRDRRMAQLSASGGNESGDHH